MKLIGLLFIFSATTLLGCGVSSKLAEKTKSIQILISFLHQLMTQMICTRASPKEVVRRLIAQGEYQEHVLIQQLAKEMEEEDCFGKALANTTSKLGRAVDKEVVVILHPLIDMIGVTDIVTQKMAMDGVIEQLEHRQQEAHKEYQAKGGLYRKMGVFAGLFVIVVLM